MSKDVQGIILAAGKGSRLGGLAVQKSLLPVKGRPIIDRALYSLYESRFVSSEITTVIGHLSDSLVNYLEGDTAYVIQKELLGTLHAVHIALNTKLRMGIIMNGDDCLFITPDIIQDSLLQCERRGADALVVVTDCYNKDIHKSAYTVGHEHKVVEISNAYIQSKKWYFTGMCVLNIVQIKEAIDKILCVQQSREYGIPQLFKLLLPREKIYACLVQTTATGINTKEDWFKANQY